MTRLLRRLDLQAASRRSLIDGARRRADVEKNDGVRGELLGVMTDHE
jgi:hypothetical protein